MKMSDPMTLEERVLSAKNDNILASELIKEYKNYISFCAQKSVGRFITQQDDEMSIAMLAFHEALKKYDPEKGPFLNFANIMIRNRVIDYIRKEDKNSNSIPFSHLAKVDEDGNISDFDVEAPIQHNYDIKYELDMLSHELSHYHITYFDLAKVTPKSQKTKKVCQSIVQYIIKTPILIHEIKTKHYLPIKLIKEMMAVNRQTLERYRKYIIAVVIILTGHYDMIAEYFSGMKGGID